MNNNQHILDELCQVILSRKGASPDSSYTASLLHKGIDKILKRSGKKPPRW